MAAELKRTALYDWHLTHSGRMVPFAGWEMPVQYPAGPLKEHTATRNAAGLFDIDHMGQIEVRGQDAEAFVNNLITYDVTQMQVFDAHYAIACYADGTCVDDLFVYKLPDEETKEHKPYYFIAINASNREKDVKWAKSHTSKYDVQVTDVSDETYMLAFQGPKAVEILNRLVQSDLETVPRFTSTKETLFDIPVLLGRTGYTGEDGFELYFPVQHALKVWEGILDAGENDGVLPVGLAARDSLRFEACMPLYGHEINASVTPVEAGLGFALNLEKEFIGKDSLLKQKLEKSGRTLIGFEMVDKGVAREGYTVLCSGEEVGHVTSGMFSPTTKKYLGMALVNRGYAVRDAEIEIIIRDKPMKAKVVKKPFYVPAYRRK